VLPTFCASNLARISPVGVNSVDLSSIVKEFSEMRKESIHISNRDVACEITTKPIRMFGLARYMLYSLYVVMLIRAYRVSLLTWLFHPGTGNPRGRSLGLVATLGIHLRIPGLPNRTTRRVTVVQLLLLQPRSRPLEPFHTENKQMSSHNNNYRQMSLLSTDLAFSISDL